MSEPKYLTDFINAVYPQSAELAMASFNEETCLVDVTKVITQLKSRNETLETGCKAQSAALDRIDTLLLSPSRIEADIEAVGGPVAPYSTDYDEEAVVERVRVRLEKLTGIVTAIKMTTARLGRGELVPESIHHMAEKVEEHFDGVGWEMMIGKWMRAVADAWKEYEQARKDGA